MAEDADRQLDEFLDKLIAEKDSLPSAELDDAFWKDLERHPFFLKEMPEEGAELHPATEALQALKWDDDDDTPFDRAMKYKDEGNKLFEYKKYRNAIVAYSEGIKQRCSDPTLNAILFSNRAASNFYLGNFRSAMRDCVWARKCKPDHLKAFVKGAECAMKLEKFQDAHNWSNAGLKIDEKNSKLIEIRERSARLQKEKERDERKKSNQNRKVQKENEEILQALKERKIRIQNDPNFDIFDRSSNPVGSSIQWNDVDRTLLFPVVFLYPEFGQTDYIEKFSEQTRIVDQLETMFSSVPAWDNDRKYKLDRLAIYYEDRDRHQLKRVPMDKTLLEVLQLPGYVVQVGMPSLIVLVDDSPFEKHYLKMFQTL